VFYINYSNNRTNVTKMCAAVRVFDTFLFCSKYFNTMNSECTYIYFPSILASLLYDIAYYRRKRNLSKKAMADNDSDQSSCSYDSDSILAMHGEFESVLYHTFGIY